MFKDLTITELIYAFVLIFIGFVKYIFKHLIEKIKPISRKNETKN